MLTVSLRLTDSPYLSRLYSRLKQGPGRLARLP